MLYLIWNKTFHISINRNYKNNVLIASGKKNGFTIIIATHFTPLDLLRTVKTSSHNQINVNFLYSSLLVDMMVYIYALLTTYIQQTAVPIYKWLWISILFLYYYYLFNRVVVPTINVCTLQNTHKAPKNK